MRGSLAQTLELGELLGEQSADVIAKGVYSWQGVSHGTFSVWSLISTRGSTSIRDYVSRP